MEACAREALKPFRAGRENIANVEKLLSLCTKDVAHFIQVLGTPATVPERPRDWYGTYWYAKTEGDPSPLDYAELGFQDEDFKGEKNAPDSSKAGAETECREMFFILRETFYGHICDKTAAAMLARWLVGKGAIVLINHGKAQSANGNAPFLLTNEDWGFLFHPPKKNSTHTNPLHRRLF